MKSFQIPEEEKEKGKRVGGSTTAHWTVIWLIPFVTARRPRIAGVRATAVERKKGGNRENRDW